MARFGNIGWRDFATWWLSSGSAWLLTGLQRHGRGSGFMVAAQSFFPARRFYHNKVAALIFLFDRIGVKHSARVTLCGCAEWGFYDWQM